MSELHKLYAIKDASDVLLKNITDGKAVALMDYANKFTIQLSSDTQYSKSKGRNSVAFADPFEGTLTTEFDNVSLSMLAMLLGSEVLSSSASEMTVKETLTVTGDATVTLKETPKTGSIYVAKKSDAREFLTVGSTASPTEVSVAGKVITFDTSAKGKIYDIFYIKESASIDKITVKGTPRTKAYRMEAFTSIKAVADSTDEDLNINLFKVSPKPNCELTFDATAPSSFSIEWDILADEAGNMLELVKEA